MARMHRRISSANKPQVSNQHKYDELLEVNLGDSQHNNNNNNNYNSEGDVLFNKVNRKYKMYIKKYMKLVTLALFLFVMFLVYANYKNSLKLTSNSNLKKNSEFSKLSSKYCTKSSSDLKPLIQYVIVIDAGSTGSRIHLYKFHNCYSSSNIEEEIFEQLKPGLSSYKNNPIKAAKSLVKLLDIAKKYIPNQMHKCTPILVKATAGLRLLGKVKSEHILEAVKSEVKKYPFYILDTENTDGISIMDGELEGVYAWITVNYLLGNLDRMNKKTVATLDLGGGSTQIVFEPTFDNNMNDELVSPFKYELSLSVNSKHVLYQYSYLGFGLMEARKKIKYKAIQANSNIDKVEIPCLAKDKIEVIDYEGKTYQLLGSADGLEKCVQLVSKIFNFDKICKHKHCSFDGIYQPNITQTFKDNDIYAFSYFYDRLEPLGLTQRYSVEQIQNVADNVCKANYDYFKNIKGAINELEQNPNRCLDLTFILTLLNKGYKIDSNRYINTEKKIMGYETGWCLGAAISALGNLKMTCDSNLNK